MSVIIFFGFCIFIFIVSTIYVGVSFWRLYQTKKESKKTKINDQRVNSHSQTHTKQIRDFLPLFFFLLVFPFLMISIILKAESFYEVQGAFRSFPQSFSIEAGSYYNEKLWSGDLNDEPWRYGFWRAGGFAAVHGQAGIRIDVYPISIWQLSLQKSVTSRFYDTENINCELIECRGIVQRGQFKTSLALGYGNYFLVPSLSLTDLSMIETPKKDFSSEEDNLTADRLGDQLQTFQWALGYKLGDRKWVFASRSSKMKTSNESLRAHYVIMSDRWDKTINYFIGGGIYDSSHAAKTFSGVVGLNWTVGEDLSFF